MASDKVIRVRFEDKIVAERCRVARSFVGRFRGFMGRKEIARDEAILFPYCNSIHTFFMRTEIDVFYLGSDGEVVALFSALKPWRLLFPQNGVKHVLETAAGAAKRIGITVGSKLICEGAWE